MILVSQVHYPGFGWLQPSQINMPFSTLFIGLVLITIARVMRIGVTMREELDATI